MLPGLREEEAWLFRIHPCSGWLTLQVPTRPKAEGPWRQGQPGLRFNISICAVYSFFSFDVYVFGVFVGYKYKRCAQFIRLTVYKSHVYFSVYFFASRGWKIFPKSALIVFEIEYEHMKKVISRVSSSTGYGQEPHFLQS